MDDLALTTMLYSYFYFGRLGLPQIQHVVQYLNEGPKLIRKLSSSEYIDLIEVLLSSTYFPTSKWKHQALVIVENLMQERQNLNRDFRLMLLKGRLELRERILRRAFPYLPWGEETGTYDLDRLLPVMKGGKWNCLCGEELVSRAQDMMNKFELQNALNELQRFSFSEEHPSAEERVVMGRINFWKAKVYRYMGEFSKAEEHFQLMRNLSSGWMIPSISSQCIAVYCELGMFNEARQYVNDELGSDACWDYEDKRRLPRLDLAGIYLMQGLWQMHRAHATIGTPLEPQVQKAFAFAKSLYHELRREYDEAVDVGRVVILGRCNIVISLGMITHLEGDSAKALIYLDSALKAARICGDLSSTEMYCAYARSEIMRRQGMFRESDDLLKEAKELLRSHGRRYFLLGYGSLYFDLVGDLIELEGGKRIAPRR